MPHFSFLTSKSEDAPALGRLEGGQSCRHQHTGLSPSGKDKGEAGSLPWTDFFFLLLLFLKRVEKGDRRSLYGTWTSVEWCLGSRGPARPQGWDQHLPLSHSLALCIAPCPQELSGTLQTYLIPVIGVQVIAHEGVGSDGLGLTSRALGERKEG